MSRKDHKKTYRHINQPHKDISIHQVERLACIGSFIRELRRADCKSQIEASKEIGIAKSTLQAAEHGESVNLLSLLKIIDGFEMTLEDFFLEMP